MRTTHSLSALLIALTLTGVLAPTLTQAEPVEVESMLGEYTGKITFRWHSPVKATTQTNPRELLLQFNRPIDAPALAQIDRNAPEWLDSVGTGFDSVLFRTSQDTKFDLVHDGNLVVVYFSPDAGSAGDTFPADSKVRLDMLEAKLMMETGHRKEGLSKLESLQKKNPKTADPLLEIANAEYAAGRWRRASHYLKDAAVIAPANEDIAALQDEIDAAVGPRMQLNYDWKQTGDNTENIGTAEGYAKLSEGARLGARYAIDYAEGDNVQLANGRLGDFNGTRERGDLYLQNDFESGDTAIASLFLGEGSVGGGAEYSYLSRLGRTNLIGEFRNPNWDYVEGVLDRATRDRVGIHHAKRFGKTTANLQVAGNRYNVGGSHHVADSVSVEGSLRYPLRDTPTRNVSVGYTIDGEYRTDVDYRVDRFGNLYAPYPMVTREIHFVDLSMQSEIAPMLIFDGMVGWGWDRLTSDNGPSLGASLTKGWHSGLEAQLHASHTLSSDPKSDSVSIAGGHLMWRF